MDKVDAIPISDARLCLNCDSVIQARICPICQSTQQLFIVQFLGSLKRDELKRFVVEDGKIKTIEIQPNANGKGENKNGRYNEGGAPTDYSKG